MIDCTAVDATLAECNIPPSSNTDDCAAAAPQPAADNYNPAAEVCRGRAVSAQDGPKDGRSLLASSLYLMYATCSDGQ